MNNASFDRPPGDTSEGHLAVLLDHATRVAFRPEVPDVVVGRFEAVRDLLLHGDRSPSFADVAFERALLTLETALRLRHSELHGTDPSLNAPSLQKLYRWAARSGLVEMDEKLLEALRRIRNRVAHPTTNLWYGGPGGAVRATLRTIDVINDVFEPAEARTARRAEAKRLSARFEALNATGADLIVGDSRIPLWRTDLLYVENRLEETEIGVAVWPRFENPSHPQEATDMREPQAIACTAAREAGGGLSLDGAGPDPVVLRALQNADATEQAAWRRNVASVAGLLAAHTIGELRRTTRDEASRRVRARWVDARAALTESDGAT